MSENEQITLLQMRHELSAASRAAITPGTFGHTHLSIVDIGRTLAKRKWLILGCTLFSVCMMAIYAYMKTPVYEGVARLQIDPMRSSSLGLEDPDKSVSPDIDGRLKTEVEIIRSNTVATQVMDSLGLYANPHFAGP